MLSDVSADADLFIFNPKTLDPETLSQQFCGACHRGVDAVAMMPDLGGINNVRFQPYRLYNSRGHDPKDARFACTACHDPHVDLKKGDALYDSKCTTCHPAGRAKQPAAEGRENGADRNPSKPPAVSKSCPVRNGQCVGCHMPKVELLGAHFQFTDHRIRIVRAGAPYPY
jgi:cytochrome c5